MVHIVETDEPSNGKVPQSLPKTLARGEPDILRLHICGSLDQNLGVSSCRRIRFDAKDWPPDIELHRSLEPSARPDPLSRLRSRRTRILEVFVF